MEYYNFLRTNSLWEHLMEASNLSSVNKLAQEYSQKGKSTTLSNGNDDSARDGMWASADMEPLSGQLISYQTQMKILFLLLYSVSDRLEPKRSGKDTGNRNFSTISDANRVRMSQIFITKCQYNNSKNLLRTFKRG